MRSDVFVDAVHTRPGERKHRIPTIFFSAPFVNLNSILFIVLRHNVCYRSISSSAVDWNRTRRRASRFYHIDTKITINTSSRVCYFHYFKFRFFPLRQPRTAVEVILFCAADANKKKTLTASDTHVKYVISIIHPALAARDSVVYIIHFKPAQHTRPVNALLRFIFKHFLVFCTTCVNIKIV